MYRYGVLFNDWMEDGSLVDPSPTDYREEACPRQYYAGKYCTVVEGMELRWKRDKTPKNQIESTLLVTMVLIIREQVPIMRTGQAKRQRLTPDPTVAGELIGETSSSLGLRKVESCVRACRSLAHFSVRVSSPLVVFIAIGGSYSSGPWVPGLAQVPGRVKKYKKKPSPRYLVSEKSMYLRPRGAIL